MATVRLLPRSIFSKMSISIALTLIVVFGYSSFQLFKLQREQALGDVRTKAIILT
ncbi:MAG: hypothetical protein GTO00_09030, partial [Deltaproteobacteria bacterium]|nr:hypothetical protein [Deltaproteobacteria bacterium]